MFRWCSLNNVIFCRVRFTLYFGAFDGMDLNVPNEETVHEALPDNILKVNCLTPQL